MPSGQRVRTARVARLRRRRVVAVAAAVAGLGGVAQLARADAPAAGGVTLAASTYEVVNVASGKALDMREWSTADGGELQQWSWAGTDNQKWRFTRQDDGSYAIANVHSGKVLDVAGANRDDGTRIVQYAKHGGTNQRFELVPLDGDGGTPRPTPKPSPSTPAPAPSPSGTGGGTGGGTSGPPAGSWKQTFADEFDGDLDGSKWHRGWACGNGQPDTCFFYDRLGSHYPDGNATVGGGQLDLRTAHESQSGQAWTSGAITTAGRFAQTYGYFEVRMKPDSRPGGDPCFWLANAESWPPEIDIAEFPGSRRGKLVGIPMLHAEGSGNDRSNTADAPGGGSWNDDFHTYGLLWEPGKLTTSIDGKVVKVVESAGVPDKDMFVIVSDEVRKDGGEWFGDPDSDTSTRHTKVDYVRVWQRG